MTRSAGHRGFGANRAFPLAQQLGLLIVVVLLVLVLSIAGKYNAPPGGRVENLFLNFDNLFNGVATSMAIYAIMAVGVTIVIVTAGIDISVGSTWALAALLTAWAVRVPISQADSGGAGVVLLALGIAVGVGAVCGAVNGALTVGLRIHPFIITLGTMSIYRGLANVLAPEKSLPGQGKILPGTYTQLIQYDFGGGLRLVPILITLATVLLGWLYLSKMIAGRETYAVGGNPEAARFSGIRVNRVLWRAYVLCGACAGLAGFVALGRWGAVSTNSGMGDELLVIAACVVGGASLAGGRGSAVGALLGALVIKLIENAIYVLHWNEEYRSIIIGLAIIVAVAIDRLSEVVRSIRLRRVLQETDR
ncbi:MAG: ABC transporter permease [Phycisphaerae bacterium]|nr:ABC transporter permease [Phycisphaerae bacterium]MDW8260943.1 ABC transporter permease [Phycisphaerales bacterium]